METRRSGVYLEQSDGVYPLSHRVEVGGTVQFHVLLSPGGGRLEGGGEGEGEEGGKEKGEYGGRRRGGGGGVWRGGRVWRKEEGREECVGRIDG